MNIAVLAAGTWGITLASLLASKGGDVKVWEIDNGLVEELLSTRRHPKLPYLEIPQSLPISSDLAATLSDAEVIVSVVPSVYMRDTCRLVAKYWSGKQMFIICSKGIEAGTHALLSDIAKEELGEGSEHFIGVLSGPSHAEEVSRDIPTAVTSAAPDLSTAERIRELFNTPRFRIYTQTDMLGVELCGALKNVIAIACGMGDGVGVGDNTRSAVIVRGLAELTRLGVAMGAQPQTLAGLAGMGDLIATCISPQSRNRYVGEQLGRGRSISEIIDEMHMVAEGVKTSRVGMELAAHYDIEMPICREVYGALYEGKSALQAYRGLIRHRAGSEDEPG